MARKNHAPALKVASVQTSLSAWLRPFCNPLHTARLHTYAGCLGLVLLTCGMHMEQAKAQTSLPGIAAPSVPDASAPMAPQRTWEEKLRQFSVSMGQHSSLPPAWVRSVLSQARYNKQVHRLMTPPPPTPGKPSTVRDWREYRSRFVNASRTLAGADFWKTHRATLRHVEQNWGVSADVIVSIIGIETNYGKNMGNIRVLDALATLAFDYPPTHPRARERGQYFQQELQQFLELCHANDMDPLAMRGSFAGAMGIPQFMPSNWKLYGEDLDGNGKADLINSPADAIASVASYLKAHGWKSGKPSYFPVDLSQVSSVDLERLLGPDILPTFTAQDFIEAGAILSEEAKAYDGLLALVELRNGDAPPSFVIGTENFYAITRYNQSSYYAMAVLDLAKDAYRLAH